MHNQIDLEAIRNIQFPKNSATSNWPNLFAFNLYDFCDPEHASLNSEFLIHIFDSTTNICVFFSLKSQVLEGLLQSFRRAAYIPKK